MTSKVVRGGGEGKVGRNLTESSRGREVKSTNGEGRGENGADSEEPQSGGKAQILDESVREESSSEDSEGSSKDGGAESSGPDIKVRVVELEEVSGVVSPAVASSVAEKCWIKMRGVRSGPQVGPQVGPQDGGSLPANSKSHMVGEQKFLRSFLR